MRGVPGSSVAASWIGGSGMSVAGVLVTDFFFPPDFFSIIALYFSFLIIIIAGFLCYSFLHTNEALTCISNIFTSHKVLC